MKIEALHSLLTSYQFHFTNEMELQVGIEQVLIGQQISFVREYELNAANRIDFMVGSIGVEIKVGHSYASVIRQLHRYAKFDEIDALMLVTTRLQHQMPITINEKPLLTVNLGLTHSL